MYRSFRSYLVLLTCLCAMTLQAGIPGVPRKVTYQGILTYLDSKGKTKTFPDNKKIPYVVSFYFYDQSEGGNWQTYNTQEVKTKKGVFEVTIGELGEEQGGMNSAAFNQLLWVEMSIISGPTIKGITYPYTVPGRIQLTSVPYAYSAYSAEVASGLANDLSLSVKTIGATTSDLLAAVRATSNYYNGVAMYSNVNGPQSRGIWCYTDSGTGVYGQSGYLGVWGYGTGFSGYGVGGLGTYCGVYASHQVGGNYYHNIAYLARNDYSGYFNGPVYIPSMLSLTSANYKIDHPLDPENKYLSHAAVESPDMMNVYNGNIELDGAGEAEVKMPEWFEALNAEFRYQLTSIGGSAPGLYIAQEVSNNAFKIAGGKPGGKVSWQVTGIRQDAYSKANRINVEQEKQGEEKGLYMHPELFNQPESKGIEYRDRMKMQERMEQAGGKDRQSVGGGDGN